MKVITFVTKAGGAFKYLEESFQRLSNSDDHELIKVGWNCKWKGFGDRLIKYREALKKLPADEVCLMIDGYDVLLTGDLGKLEDEYRKSGDRRVVFSTEKHNFLSKYGNRYFMGPPVTLNDGVIVYICAGAYIGFADSIITMLNKVIDNGDCDSLHADDQYLLTRVCREAPDEYRYDIGMSWFITWPGYTEHVVGNEIELNSDGTVSYQGKTGSFVLHRQFAADMKDTIMGLGYEMSSADICAVKRDSLYLYNFHIHHVYHKWLIIPILVKILFFLILMVIVILILNSRLYSSARVNINPQK